MMSTTVIEQTQQTMQSVNKITSLNPQLTYSYIVRDNFYAIVPGELKQYYFNNIRLMLNWYQGFVPEVHHTANGIFSTRIGNSIVKEIAKLIVGGQVFYGNKYQEAKPQETKNQTLIDFDKWVSRVGFQNFVKRLVEYTAAGGTTAIVTTINGNKDLVPTLYRIDQFFHETDLKGDVISFTGFLKSYTAVVDNGAGRNKTERLFYLLVKRYFNEKGEAVQKIFTKTSSSSVVSAQTFNTIESNEIQWQQLPKIIRERIKEDYGNQFKLGEEQKLPTGINGIGVRVAKWTSTNTIPEVDLGESALANVISYLIGYEQAYSEMITDLYLARGKVLTPQQFTNPQDPNNAYYSDFDGMLFTKMPYTNSEEQKPMSIQFELRAEEWIKVRNNFAENIASAIGVSGSDMFSYLRDSTGSSKTATQIASEAQKTISYIEEKRVIFKEVLNDFIENEYKPFYRVKDDFGVKFSSQNHVNMLVTTEQIRVMHEVGFDFFTIYQHFFPDLDSAQVTEMVNRKFEDLKRTEMVKALANAEAFKVATQGNDEENEDNELNGGKGDNETLQSLAEKHNVSVDYLQKQLEKGVKVEKEHTQDDKQAKEIAMDHLTESADYYIKLEKVE